MGYMETIVYSSKSLLRTAGFTVFFLCVLKITGFVIIDSMNLPTGTWSSTALVDRWIVFLFSSFPFDCWKFGSNFNMTLTYILVNMYIYTFTYMGLLRCCGMAVFSRSCEVMNRFVCELCDVCFSNSAIYLTQPTLKFSLEIDFGRLLRLEVSSILEGKPSAWAMIRWFSFMCQTVWRCTFYKGQEQGWQKAEVFTWVSDPRIPIELIRIISWIVWDMHVSLKLSTCYVSVMWWWIHLYNHISYQYYVYCIDTSPHTYSHAQMHRAMPRWWFRTCFLCIPLFGTYSMSNSLLSHWPCPFRQGSF